MANILIIDDNDALETLYQWMLKPHGHDVHFARTAGAALEMLETPEMLRSPPTVCFVDLSLPDMSCADLVREMRKKLGDGVPLVVLTGHARDAAERFLEGAAVDAICEKPYDLEDLEAVVLRHLPS